ncbi:MAG: HesA/MoeB/ThiF family protein, partial [Zoogloeaceae bacterium]|nr:HesA/MoeB/ThiF family protein [Zoogloeaceae bacterium]
MNDDDLLRYSRHILLDELGIEGQERIRAGHVLIVGMGGLGSPAALYLAAAGVGTLTLADGDAVELSNLQRQILHNEARIGRNKAESAQIALRALNPHPRLIPIAHRLEGEALSAEVARADLVLDCSDNFPTRYAINRACLEQAKPLVSGAASGFAGLLAVCDLRDSQSPCYHCLFPDGESVGETRCATTGVFAPLVGLIGSLQAGEGLRLLAGLGHSFSGRLLRVDLLTQSWKTSRFERDSECAA